MKKQNFSESRGVWHLLDKLLVSAGALWFCLYRGTSLIRDSAPLGPYRRNMPRVL